MAQRRPVCVVSGKERQLPAGDTLAGVPAKVMVILNGGTTSFINLSVNSTLPLLLNGGTTYNLPVTVNG